MAKGVKTGWRRAGVPNKRSRARQQAFATVKTKIEKALGKDAFEGDAHALMVATYKDTRLPLDLRLDAAKAAAPYEKQRLATTTLQGPDGSPLISAANSRSVIEDVRRLIEEEMAKIEGPIGNRPANQNRAR